MINIRSPRRLDWDPTPQWWEAATPPCVAHDHERLRPEVVAVPPLAAPAASSATTTSIIYPEAQVIKKLKNRSVSSEFILTVQE